MVDIQSISTGLQLGQDGIWRAADSENISYPADGNETYFSIEENSFWFKHRNNCIVSVVNCYPPSDKEPLFDIGGGNGFVSLGLADAGFEVVLVEPGVDGAISGKKRGLKNVICATTNTAKFKRHSLPAVGLFDVIEHIEDDLAFLKSVKELIKVGGYLYLTVPAYSFLWSDEDVSAGHYRRYTISSASDVLKSAGFQLEFSSYIFRFLPLPIFLFRTLPFKIGLSKKTKTTGDISRDHAVDGGMARKILNALLQSEINNLRNNKPMAFGGSCLLVAKSV